MNVCIVSQGGAWNVLGARFAAAGAVVWWVHSMLACDLPRRQPESKVWTCV